MLGAGKPTGRRALPSLYGCAYWVSGPVRPKSARSANARVYEYSPKYHNTKIQKAPKAQAAPAQWA